MISHRTRLMAFLAMVVIALGVQPAFSFARPAGAAAPGRVPRVAASAAASAAPDWREPGDETTSGAQDLTTFINRYSPWGDTPVEATHTLSWASNDSTLTATDARGDQDWYKFTVDPYESFFGQPYVIEAKALQSGVDPVIEVYGPVDSSHSIAPSDPRTIFNAGHETDLENGNPTCVAANDDGPWFGGGWSSSVWFMPAATRHQVTYYFRVRPFFGATRSGDTTVALGYMDSAGSYKLRIKLGSLTRLAGTNRVRTSVAVSRERYVDGDLPSVSFDGTGTVVLASATNYPDALAGSTLAGAVNGPILLTAPDSLSRDVASEIRRLGAKRVFLLGSTDAISQKAEDQLRTVVPDVERIFGDSRVETAIKIAARAKEMRLSKCAFIANGWSFADAVSASPMAAHNVAPILLTHKNSLDASTSEAIGDLGITDVVIVGSPAAVSDTVRNQLATLLGGTGHVKRIGGSNRYETSRNFAMFATGEGTSGFAGTLASPDALRTLDYRGMAVCSGSNFADALSGGVFAGGATSGFPLLLTPGPGTMERYDYGPYWFYFPSGYLPSPWIFDLWGALPAGKTPYLLSVPGGGAAVGRSYAIGGPAAVSDSTYYYLNEIIGVEQIYYSYGFRILVGSAGTAASPGKGSQP